jgi:hypothetical protein
MKSEPGPPMTLGNAAAAGLRLIGWCLDMRRQVERDPKIHRYFRMGEIVVLKITERWRAGKDTREKAIAYWVTLMLGWLWCTLLLSGPFAVGIWAFSYIGWGKDPLIFGLLAAIGFVWMYERLETDAKIDRLTDRIEGLGMAVQEKLDQRR